MVMRIRRADSDGGRIRIGSGYGTQGINSSGDSIEVGKKFDYLDPRNTIIIDGEYSIGFLDLTTRIKNTLIKQGFKTLKDLQENMPTGIGVDAIFDIYGKLKLFENGKYKPKWKLPVNLLRNHFSKATINVLMGFGYETLNEIVIDPEFKEKLETLNKESANRLKELFISLQLIKESSFD